MRDLARNLAGLAAWAVILTSPIWLLTLLAVML
jgi:hypothetical protein